MKLVIKILLLLISIVCLISIYWILARYTEFVFDEILEKGKWGNVNPILTLIMGFVSITILTVSLKYYRPIFQTTKAWESIKVGFIISSFFIIIATLFWSDSWTETPSLVLDSRELGDEIWKLGHPLTFIIIDLPIYFRRNFDGLETYWMDLWAYPSVLSLFVIQFSIYIHGLRLMINYRKIKTTYNNPYS